MYFCQLSAGPGRSPCQSLSEKTLRSTMLADMRPVCSLEVLMYLTILDGPVAHREGRAKNHYRRTWHRLDVSTAGWQCTSPVHPVKRSWGHDLAWPFLSQMLGLEGHFLCLNLSVQKITYAWWWHSFEKVIKEQDQCILLAGGRWSTAGWLGPQPWHNREKRATTTL